MADGDDDEEEPEGETDGLLDGDATGFSCLIGFLASLSPRWLACATSSLGASLTAVSGASVLFLRCLRSSVGRKSLGPFKL